MKRLLAEKDKVEFIKQVPLHPRERLKRATKNQNEIRFIKQVLVHPRGRNKRKEKKIIGKNTNLLSKNEFDFSPKKIWNKVLLFDTLRVDDKVIMDKIIEKLPKDNDRYYIEHVTDSNKFILRKENGR